jgi:hypothetical protein
MILHIYYPNYMPTQTVSFEIQSKYIIHFRIVIEFESYNESIKLTKSRV